MFPLQTKNINTNKFLQRLKFYIYLYYSIHLHIRIQILIEIYKRAVKKGYVGANNE